MLAVAKQYTNFVRVDMEESACTDRTLAAVIKGFEAHGNVGVAIQSMLLRSDKDVRMLNEKGVRMRLVKGAYLEPPDVARQSKPDIDEAYIALGEQMLENGTYPAFGTHDDAIIKQLREYASEKEIGAGNYEFQMLFGIRRPLQKSLKNEGVNVRVYVPYGTSWYPYFSRRLAERPANLFFFIRALFGK